MIIRKTEMPQLERVMDIYRAAREFMKEQGNPDQWRHNKPSRDDIVTDIENGDSYVVLDEGEIVAVFFFRRGTDPTYHTIYDGEWISDAPYAVIHRLAVEKKGSGVAAFIFDTCFSWHPNLRIDTHRDNKPMQRALEKSGFSYCGIIHLATGEPRLAYQRL